MPEAVIYSHTVEGRPHQHMIWHPEIQFKCMLCNKSLLEENFAYITEAKAKTEPQKHRGTEVGSYLWGWLVWTPVWIQSWLLWTLLSWVFEYLQVRRLYRFSGQSGQLLDHPHKTNLQTNKQKSWIIFKWNLLFFNLCPFPLVLLVGSTEYGSIFFTLPSRYSFRYSADIHQSPAFFSSGRTVPAFSPSTQLQSLEHFCSPSLYLFHYVPVCLILRSPEMDPALQISLTSLEQRGSFSLTAGIALPNAPRRLFAFLSAKAHSLIRFNMLSIRITRTNFAELFLSYFASAWVMSLHVQDFSLLNFIKLGKLTLRRGSLAKQLFAMHRKYDSIYFLWYILVANKMIANLRAIFWWF